MKVCNIFIPLSPLQLLNCIEAVHHFKTDINILLLPQNGETNNLSQMHQLLEAFEWDEVKRIPFPQARNGRISFAKAFKSRILFAKTIKLTLKQLDEYIIDKVFVGEYRINHLTHMVNKLGGKDVYLVDDGLAMLMYGEHINQQLDNHIMRAIVYKIFSYQLCAIDFKLFTAFDLKQDNVIKNKYAYIKKNMKKKTISPNVYFIGQPLVESKIMSESAFKLELKRVINFYANKHFVFILHRRQNTKLIKKLAIELGFEYMRFNQLIEFEMINSSTLPSQFATFYSTAIITLKKILGRNCTYTSFKISQKYINADIDIPALEKCYSEFTNNDIELIQP